MKSGFTLIELLVVVAIISILAAIAVPNFLEAQTRAKVARILSDMRVLTTGLESYAVDNGKTPPRHDSPTFLSYLPRLSQQMQEMSVLTSPVSYLSTLPVDIFARGNIGRPYLIDYFDPPHVDRFVRQYRGEWINNPNRRLESERSHTNYLLVSVGPDGYLGYVPPPSPVLGLPREGRLTQFTQWIVYDPTNGSVSRGNIFRFRNQAEPSSLLRRN